MNYFSRVNIFFLTGENSGDEIAGAVAKVLVDQGHQVIGWGGVKLSEAGVNIVRDITSLSVMGFAEVLGMMRKYSRLISRAKADVVNANTDVVVLVDYGYFNLKMARWAHEEGLKVVYLSPPKVWASRSGRAKLLTKYCDEVIVVFPFEKILLNELGVDAQFFGHPLAKDDVEPKKNKSIAILPGSRRQEIIHNLPVMMEGFEKSSYQQATISCANGIEKELIHKIAAKYSDKSWDIHSGNVYDILADAEVALATSGTVTMHCLLTDTLQVVCYKTSEITYQIAKRLIQVPFIALPNLIAGRKIIPELIQHNCTSKRILEEIHSIKINKDEILREYGQIKNQVYRPEAALSIAKTITNKIK